MWWPSPEAFKDLIVEEAEYGFDLSAPDGTECGEWLAYWSQSEEYHKIFTEEFMSVLRNHVNNFLESNGKNEWFPDGREENRVEAQDDEPGSQS
jgi:hypothetical protein